jgi:hypothetical protein
LCWEGDAQWFLFIEIHPDDPLSWVREKVTESGIDLRHPHFVFTFKGSAVLHAAERKSIKEFLVAGEEGHPTLFVKIEDSDFS